jgi:hypothetical protein
VCSKCGKCFGGPKGSFSAKRHEITCKKDLPKKVQHLCSLNFPANIPKIYPWISGKSKTDILNRLGSEIYLKSPLAAKGAKSSIDWNIGANNTISWQSDYYY